MSKRIRLFLPLTLGLLLLLSATTYALTPTWYSTINPSVINMSGYSVTGTDEVCYTVQTYNWFYRDGVYVDSGSDVQWGATWAQANVSSLNRPGTQTWRLDGSHFYRQTENSMGYSHQTSVSLNY